MPSWSPGRMVARLFPLRTGPTSLRPSLRRYLELKNTIISGYLPLHQVVFVKQWCDSPEVKLELLKEPWTPDSVLPNTIPPHGLSLERQWYLHDQIWPFCAEEDKDTTCPLPSAPKPGGSRRCTPHPEEPSVVGEATPPPKRRRVCGVCHESGHDKRNCSKK